MKKNCDPADTDPVATRLTDSSGKITARAGGEASAEETDDMPAPETDASSAGTARAGIGSRDAGSLTDGER